MPSPADSTGEPGVLLAPRVHPSAEIRCYAGDPREGPAHALGRPDCSVAALLIVLPVVLLIGLGVLLWNERYISWCAVPCAGCSRSGHERVELAARLPAPSEPRAIKRYSPPMTPLTTMRLIFLPVALLGLYLAVRLLIPGPLGVAIALAAVAVGVFGQRWPSDAAEAAGRRSRRV